MKSNFMPSSRLRILGPHHATLLRAAFSEGDQAIEAYRAWRASVELDAIDGAAYRVLPLLLKTAQKHGVDDPELRRMRGVAKHIWLSNMLRLRLLGMALDALALADVRVLLLKGGALFARYDEVAAARAAEDYDLLIRPSDAPRAIRALIGAGFKTHFGIRADRFEEADFATIHAAHFARGKKGGNLDLHWRPLPRLFDPAYVDDLFAHCDQAKLAGRDVSVPSLADHLFVTVARPEPWEQHETFIRAAEAAQLLRASGGQLDWRRFEQLATRYGYSAMASSMLRLVRDELCAPIPDAVIRHLWRDQWMLNTIELAQRRTAPYKRTPRQRFMLRVIELIRAESLRMSPASTAAVLVKSGPRNRLHAALRSYCAKPDLALIWREQVACGTEPKRLSFVRGFSFPEEEGRWTDGDVAVLELPVNASPGNVVQLRFIVRPFFPPGASRFAFNAVTMEGKIGEHVLTTAQGWSIEVALKAQVVGRGTGRKAVIVLQLLDAGHPIALGLSDDPRLLGLFVEDVRVAVDEAALGGAGI